MDLTYQFTNKNITPWGGMAFLNKMGFSEQVSTCDFISQPGSNRGYSPSVIRMESGFCSEDIMSYMEDMTKPLSYIVAAKFYHPIQRLIAGNENWILMDEGIETICEKQYQAEGSEKARRMVIVRQKISVCPQATGKTLSLFPEEEICRNYRYSAYFTNLDFASAEIWRLYCPGGDAENRIKEIKYDFGFDSFNLNGFYATEAALTFVMIAYNLMSIFRMFVLQKKKQKRLSTLRWRTFAIGTYFRKYYSYHCAN